MLDTDLSAYVSDIIEVFFRNMIYGKWHNTICISILVAENVKKALENFHWKVPAAKGLTAVGVVNIRAGFSAA